MRILLDHSSGIITAETICDSGKTPFLEHCSGSWYTVETLSFLLARGANIHTRDSSGQTCLHLCFYGVLAIRGIMGLQRCRHAQTYLIRRGADVFAVDSTGSSVSDMAYGACGPDRYSSASGDLWDVVLADCGYDVAQFRKAHLPRKARYGGWYTRQVFEELWKGQEHLCPYYYDEETFATDDESGGSTSGESYSSSDEEDGGGCILDLGGP
jgi:hypothetical protein